MDGVALDDRAYEETLVAAAAKAGVHPTLAWRPEEYPGGALLAALRAPRADHPKEPSDVVYVTTRPLAIGGPSSDAEQLDVGDVLTPEEVEHSGSALASLVTRGHLVALPVDRGIVASFTALLRRISRLEAAIRLSSLSDSELLALAGKRGLLSGDS